LIDFNRLYIADALRQDASLGGGSHMDHLSELSNGIHGHPDVNYRFVAADEQVANAADSKDHTSRASKGLGGRWHEELQDKQDFDTIPKDNKYSMLNLLRYQVAGCTQMCLTILLWGGGDDKEDQRHGLFVNGIAFGILLIYLYKHAE
jgi:hypothetical protein